MPTCLFSGAEGKGLGKKPIADVTSFLLTACRGAKQQGRKNIHRQAARLIFLYMFRPG